MQSTTLISRSCVYGKHDKFTIENLEHDIYLASIVRKDFCDQRHGTLHIRSKSNDY